MAVIADGGTQASPAFTFTSDQDTGLFSSGVNEVGITCGGIERLFIGDDGQVGIPEPSTKFANQFYIGGVQTVAGDSTATFGNTFHAQPQLPGATVTGYILVRASIAGYVGNPGWNSITYHSGGQNGENVNDRTGIGGTSQIGYRAGNMWSASTNYGFLSQLDSSPVNFPTANVGTQYNFYQGGNAPNYFNGAVSLAGAYESATGNSPNVYIDNDGNIKRTVSATRYATGVTDLTDSEVDTVINGLRPVKFQTTVDGTQNFVGLLAEEVNTLDARLAKFNRPLKTVTLEAAQTSVTSGNGDLLRAAVTRKLADTSQTAIGEGVELEGLVAMLVDYVQRLNTRITALGG